MTEHVHCGILKKQKAMIIDLSNDAHLFLVSLFVLVLIGWTVWMCDDTDSSFAKGIGPVVIGVTAFTLGVMSLIGMIGSTLHVAKTEQVSK